MPQEEHSPASVLDCRSFLSRPAFLPAHPAHSINPGRAGSRPHLAHDPAAVLSAYTFRLRTAA